VIETDDGYFCNVMMDSSSSRTHNFCKVNGWT